MDSEIWEVGKKGISSLKEQKLHPLLSSDLNSMVLFARSTLFVPVLSIYLSLDKAQAWLFWFLLCHFGRPHAGQRTRRSLKQSFRAVLINRKPQTPYF